MTPRRPEDSFEVSSTDDSTSIVSRSPLADLYDSHAFQLEWDNDLRFNVARHLIRLRKYRHATQTDVAERAGTSQSRVARVEGGDENITLDSLVRLVEGLHGRVRLSIEPAELSFPTLPPWWVCLTRGVVARDEAMWTRSVIQTYQPYPGETSGILAAWKLRDTPDTPDAVTINLPPQRAQITAGAPVHGHEIRRDLNLVNEIARSWS